MYNKIYIIVKVIGILICAYCFFLAWKFAWLNYDKQSVAFLITGFVFIFIFFADEIAPKMESVNIFGCVVKLREVKKIIQDLTNLLIAVAGLSFENTLNPILNEKPSYNRMEYKYKEITDLLKKYHVQDNVITEIQKRHWHKKICKIYTKMIIDSLIINKKSNDFWYKWDKKEGKPLIVPKLLKKETKDFDIQNDKKIKYHELLKQYEYYYKVRKHKNLDIFVEALKEYYDYWGDDE